MEREKLYEGEYRFMEIIWDHAPVGSGELVKLCAEAFSWKKSTTYTMIKKMCEKGYISSEAAVIQALVPRAEAEQRESEYVIDHTFQGSLPAFIAAFLGNKKISREEADALQRMIEEHREDG